MRVEPGADRGAALRQRIELLQRQPHADDAAPDLRGVAGEFLAERQRRRVLRVGAADLDDARECLRLRLQRVLQMRERRIEQARDLVGRRDVHRGREAVVRRLAHVDVIVGMHRRFRAELAAEHLVGAVGDHLVDVHVGLGAGAGLPDHQREMIVELAVDHLLRGLDDGARAAGVEQAERAVDLGGGALDDAERADQRPRHALGADAEVLDRALGLRAPIAVGRHLDRAEAVGLGAGLARLLAWRGPAPSLLAEAVEPHDLAARACRAAASSVCRGGRGLHRRRAGLRLAGGGGCGTLVRAAPWRAAAAACPSACAAAFCSLASPAGGASAVASASPRCVSNCSANCTDGSTKLLIAVERHQQPLRHAAERQADLERLVAHLQVPELVLQHDGHFLRILLAQARRQPHALGAWCRR